MIIQVLFNLVNIFIMMRINSVFWILDIIFDDYDRLVRYLMHVLAKALNDLFFTPVNINMHIIFDKDITVI